MASEPGPAHLPTTHAVILPPLEPPSLLPAPRPPRLRQQIMDQGVEVHPLNPTLPNCLGQEALARSLPPCNPAHSALLFWIPTPSLEPLYLAASALCVKFLKRVRDRPSTLSAWGSLWLLQPLPRSQRRNPYTNSVPQVLLESS